MGKCARLDIAAQFCQFDSGDRIAPRVHTLSVYPSRCDELAAGESKSLDSGAFRIPENGGADTGTRKRNFTRLRAFPFEFVRLRAVSWETPQV